MSEFTSYTYDELVAHLLSRKKLTPPHTVGIKFTTVDPLQCAREVILLRDYEIEYYKRETTRLRREKILLRAALEEALQTIYRANDVHRAYWGTQWEERILDKTEDKDGPTRS